MASDRRLGCLSIFLFIALCASLFVNFVLMIAAFQRVGGIREAEPIPRFREILLQRGARASMDKIAVITMRGLISTSIPGNVSDSMVDDLRAALQQAREDSRVKAIVLEIDSPGGEVTASDEIYSAVVKTRRLHFAKKLIDETKLPMSEIALASGFGCTRRFNAAIRKVYKRTPTQIRRLSRLAGLQPENQYTFRLRFRPPYHWDGMLRFLAARATPGVESVAEGTYRRTISVEGSHGFIDVALDPENDALVLRVQFGDPRALFFIVERIRAMFDLNADWTSIVPSLKADSVLGKWVNAEPGLRVPGCWNGFELAIRAILGQQITVKGATALAGTLVRTFGQPVSGAGNLTHLFPTPEILAEADLGRIGMPRSRSATIRAFAKAVCHGQVTFEGIVGTDEFLAQLCEIPGIGNWTAQYIAMRALGEPDAFPSGDLGLLRALGLENPRDLERRAEAWRPWRAYATMYLWHNGAHLRASGNASVSQSATQAVAAD